MTLNLGLNLLLGPILVLAATLLAAHPASSSPDSRGDRCLVGLNSPSHWLRSPEDLAIVAEINLFRNISSPGTAPGTVLASPSQHDPNYFYHWVRDAALTMDFVRELWGKSGGVRRAQTEKILFDYVSLSKAQQETANPAGGLGEVRFKADGTVDWGGWMRPQNDGPALRALTLARFAHTLLDQGRGTLVHTRLYNGELPATSIIKRDLEYTSHHWHEVSFDLWEEVLAQNFFTMMAQRAALLEGATLANRLKDFDAAKHYREQARQIDGVLNWFWRQDRGFILAALNHSNDRGRDRSGIDIAPILASLHSSTPGFSFGVSDDRILSHAHHLRVRFEQLYKINRDNTDPAIGTAIGRYPEDDYDGYHTGRSGNPWFIATNAYASLYGRLARELKKNGELQINSLNRDFFQALPGVDKSRITAGKTLRAGQAEFESVIRGLRIDAQRFIARSVLHTSAEGSMSEQMNRDTGIMQGARDLTWSYESFIRAVEDQAQDQR